MTNAEFFSKIYGADTVSILRDHGMAIVSATETIVGVEYKSAADNLKHYISLECDDNISIVDAMANYASFYSQNGIEDGELLETVAAKLREAQEKHPTRLVHLELEADLYEKLCLLSNENDINTTLLSLIKDARVPLEALNEEQREMRLNEAEELLAPLITEAVTKAAYGRTGVEITPSSYDDIISPDTIMKAYDEYRELSRQGKNDWETFKGFLEQELYESYFWQWEDDEAARLYESVKNHIEEAIEGDEKLAEAWEAIEGTYTPYDILELGGLTDGIYVDLDAFLNNETYHINLMFAGKAERDTDMSAIKTLFTDNEHLIKDADNFARYQDNALSYLIRQQGYTTADVLGVSGQNGDCKFIESVKSELDNTFNSMNELTCLTSCKGVELVELLDKIVKGEGDTMSHCYIELSKQTETGLFNEWNGSGSVLEIVLEKPAVFPAAMVRNVQFEGAKPRPYEYNVDSVYGLTGGVWNKSTFTLTDTPPVLREEDFEATRMLLIPQQSSRQDVDATGCRRSCSQAAQECAASESSRHQER